MSTTSLVWVTYLSALRDSHAPWFMFYAYGFDLSDRIWLVYIVKLMEVHHFRVRIMNVLVEPCLI